MHLNFIGPLLYNKHNEQVTILFSTVRVIMKARRCLFYASSGFLNEIILLYGKATLKFF